jgi:hypothetical protein
MAIYAWPGLEVQITEARMAPIWVERQSCKIVRHMKEKKPTRLTKELTATVGWFVKLKATDDGHQLYNGKWSEMHLLRADDGIKDLNTEFGKMIGDAELAKFREWNKGDSPDATHYWPLLSDAEVS